MKPTPIRCVFVTASSRGAIWTSNDGKVWVQRDSTAELLAAMASVAQSRMVKGASASTTVEAHVLMCQ